MNFSAVEPAPTGESTQYYRHYNLHLGFARASGALLAPVHVIIEDDARKVVLHALADGALLFVDLPPGIYRVAAECDGRVLSQRVEVGTRRGPIRYFSF